MPGIRIQGGCHCGAIRYEASAGPRGGTICHCRSCRRLTGAPAVAWASFEASQVRFTAGDPQELASSPGVRRRFCRDCGTHLSYESQASPGELDLTTASLDDPGAFAPAHHTWMSHNIAWVRFGDGLPAFAETAHGAEP